MGGSCQPYVEGKIEGYDVVHCQIWYGMNANGNATRCDISLTLEDEDGDEETFYDTCAEVEAQFDLDHEEVEICEYGWETVDCMPMAENAGMNFESCEMTVKFDCFSPIWCMADYVQDGEPGSMECPGGPPGEDERPGTREGKERNA